MTKDNTLPRWAWRVGFIALLIGVLMMWGLLSVHYNGKERQRHHAERELQVVSQLQSMSLRAWREQRMTDAAVLSENTVLGQAVTAWFVPDKIGTERAYLQSQLERDLRILQEQRNYSAVYLVDTDGVARLSAAGVTNKVLPEAEFLALQQAFEGAQPTVVEPRRDPAFAFPFFSLLAPIYNATDVVGAVWLVMDVRASLYPLLEQWPTGSATAESAIMMRDDDSVLILSPLRAYPEMELPYRISLTRSSDPAVQTVQGMRGIFYGSDDHDTAIIAVANIVPDSPWYLLSKIDAAEVFASEWRELLTLALPVLIGLLCGGAVLTFLQRQAWLRERELKDQLERTLRWLENAQETAAVGYFAYNLNTRIFSVSPTTRKVFGLTVDAPMSLERWLGGVHPVDRKMVSDAYRRAVSQRNALNIRHRITRESDHQERWVETWGEYEVDTNNKGSVRLIGIVQDITDRKRIEEELEKAKIALEAQVRLDPLTGIANRLALDERLKIEWQRTSRHSQPLSLLMIDVDYFKSFNDDYGHVAGDQCLQRVARVISTVVMRSLDLVARYGGEEFVVLLPDTDSRHAADLAGRICAAMRTEGIEHKKERSSGILTVSIGVVSVYPDAATPVSAGIQTLLEHADMALYVAKNAGRDRVAIYAEGTVRVLATGTDRSIETIPV